MAKDFLMNACGDMDITDGDAQLVSGADQVRQAWIIRMSTYLGEWFLDQTIGIPYIQQIFSKILSVTDLKKIFTDETLKTPGVIRVTNVVVGKIDPSTREVNVDVYADIEGEENALLRYTGTIPADGCETTGSTEYPLTLGDLAIWFDASDSSSYAASASSIVMQNKAGTGTATGTGTAGVPTISLLNGETALLFDDADDQHMVIEDTPAIRNASGDMAYFTVFIVAYADNNGTSEDPMGLFGLSGVDGGTVQSATLFTYDDGSPNVTYYAINSFGTPYSQEWSGIEDVMDLNLYTLRIESTDSSTVALTTLYEDGAQNGSAINVGGLRLDGDGVLGAVGDVQGGVFTVGDYFSGRIGEILVYSEALGDTEREAVETFLIEKWGI